MFKNTIKTIVGFSVAFALLLVAVAPAYADNDKNKGKENDDRDSFKQEREVKEIGSTLEVHITERGNVLVRGAKVTAISGNTISASTAWGGASMAWNVVTDGNTQFIRRAGGKSSISEISVGDFVSFQGALQTSVTSPFTVQAKIVRDWSIQKQNATFSGTVQSVDSVSQSFVLSSENRGNVTVFVSTSTKVEKGGVSGVFSDIVAGVKATVSGLYNNLTSRIDADKVQIRVEKPQPITVEGKIKTPPASTSAPTTMVVTMKDKDYTVSIASDTSVLNVFWLRIPLSSLKAGDNIRIYGLVNSASSTIDATVIRDTSVR